MNSYLSENLYIDKKENWSPYFMPLAHRHQSYELYYLKELSGDAHIYIGDNKFPLKAGCMVIIDSNVTHQTDYSQSTYYKRFLLEVNPSFLKNELGKVIGTPIDLFFQQYTGVHYLDKHTSSKIASVLTTIYNESILKEKYYEEVVLLRILEIILLMDRSSEQLAFENALSANQRKTIRPVVQYVVENIRDNLCLEALAEQFHLDKSYLSRIFKQYTGQTVHEFINVKKVEMAQRLLLLETASSVSHIAFELGFSNGAYFSKIFKKYVGITPTKFRKNNDKKMTVVFNQPFHNKVRSKSLLVEE